MYYTKNENGDYVEVSETLVPESEIKSLKDKNSELRATNTSLLKSNETLSAFADVLDGVQNISPESLTKKIEEKARVKAESIASEMKKSYEEKISELDGKLKTSTSILSKHVLSDSIRKVGTKHGILETAYDDVIRRAQDAFDVVEGNLKFKEDKLDSTGQPMSIESWMSDLVKTAPHLAQRASGPGFRQNNGIRDNALNKNDKISPQAKIAAGLNTKAKNLN